MSRRGRMSRRGISRRGRECLEEEGNVWKGEGMSKGEGNVYRGRECLERERNV